MGGIYCVKIINQKVTEKYSLFQGDCVETIKGLPDNSIHYSIFSPPFANLYTYSNSDRDMGNSTSDEEFYNHFKFLVKELYRVLKNGRLISFHCMDIPMMKSRDGAIGLKDFSGELIKIFKEVGFIYHSRVTIWKDPLVEATRTKALGLMHKQICKDSAMCRNGLPDYIITMRKPGDNEEPISHEFGFSEFYGQNEPEGIKGEIPANNDQPVYSHNVWRRYANPVWADIRQGNTLNAKAARDNNDERHICPLQLDVINRCLSLWTNPNDIVLDPFNGIGSTCYCALGMGRRSIGIELKESYFKQSVINLENKEQELSNAC